MPAFSAHLREAHVERGACQGITEWTVGRFLETSRVFLRLNIPNVGIDRFSDIRVYRRACSQPLRDGSAKFHLADLLAARHNLAARLVIRAVQIATIKGKAATFLFLRREVLFAGHATDYAI